jgi:uncharacterized protein YdhG (YjbR/CyaY superfamily)
VEGSSAGDVSGIAEAYHVRRRARDTVRARAMRKNPTTIDEYLAGIPAAQRAALQRLREMIRAIVPDAEECISYKIPAFRVGGRVVAGFAAKTNGCSYYPFSGSTLRTLARAVARYSQTKSALHFSTDQPLPAGLVRKLIAARIAERK